MTTYYEERLEPWHLQMMMEAEPADLPEDMETLEHFQYLATQPNSWALVSSDGEVLWCGGTIEQWPGRHVGWAYVSQFAGPAALRVTRFAVSVLNAIQGRVEMTVQADFENGHRWAQLLGFEVETPLMRAYGPNGEDHVGYVRFN